MEKLKLPSVKNLAVLDNIRLHAHEVHIELVFELSAGELGWKFGEAQNGQIYYEFTESA